MNSLATRRFWKLFRELPHDVQRLAVRSHKLWTQDPVHPSLRFRRLHGGDNILYTVRMGEHHRALARQLNSHTIAWIWIGTHAEYDHLVG